MLLVDISYPIPNRLNKIGEFFEDEYQIIKVLWDREGISNDYKSDERVLVSDFGYGEVKSLFFHLFDFYRFLHKQIQLEDPDLVICRYWIPSLLCLLRKSRYKLIYDVNDIPYGSKAIVKISKLVEKYVLKHVNWIFLSSRFQMKLYKKYVQKITLLENRVSNKLKRIEPVGSEQYPQNISFIGQIRYKEILIKLIDEVSSSYEINLYGKGSDSEFIESYLKNGNYPHVHSFGSYSYKEIAAIYQNSGFVWAVYPSDDENVQIAISNKFFECIFFERIILVNEKTELGNLVKEWNIGITVDLSHFDRLIEDLCHCDLAEKLNNIREYKQKNQLYWEDYKAEIMKNENLF